MNPSMQLYEKKETFHFNEFHAKEGREYKQLMHQTRECIKLNASTNFFQMQNEKEKLFFTFTNEYAMY